MPIPDRTRYSYVYHPSRPHKERWEKAAAKAHTSLSKLIIAAVDGLLDEDEEFQPRREMVRELESLRNENKSLRDDLKQKTIVLDRYEAELKRYRAQPFQEEDYRGMRRYSKELVEILKTRGQADSYKILEALGIDPRESELVKAISRQLEELQAYGMIKTDGRSWQWIV
jgi:uncharacterized caspase-like protein